MSPELEKQLDIQLDILRRSYETENSSKWGHFYCPILHVAEPADLCLGHVIPKELPNSPNATVPQRQDVDNFFGRTVESVFINSVRVYNKPLFQIFQNPAMRRFVRPTLEIAGSELEYYPVKTDEHGHVTGDISKDHALLQLENADGSKEHFGLKVDSESLVLLKNEVDLQATAEVDFSASAVGCLLHSAHLTMFKILKYRYANSPAGVFLGHILRGFYLKYRDKRNVDIPAIAYDYFWQYRNLVRPMSERPEWSQGTITDNRMLVWEGTSGRHLAFGVMVNVAGMMHTVWMQSGDPETVPEFLSLLTSPPQFMLLRVTEIALDAHGNGTHRSDPELMRVEWKATEIRAILQRLSVSL